MRVIVTAPEEYTGDIMGDLSQRRGRPSGMDTRSGQTIVEALVPLAEMLTYAPALRSMTQGRASFVMESIGYEEVPELVLDKTVADAKARMVEEAED
jgi:elongation factor G